MCAARSDIGRAECKRHNDQEKRTSTSYENVGNWNNYATIMKM